MNSPKRAKQAKNSTIRPRKGHLKRMRRNPARKMRETFHLFLEKKKSADLEMPTTMIVPIMKTMLPIEMSTRSKRRSIPNVVVIRPIRTRPMPIAKYLFSSFY